MLLLPLLRAEAERRGLVEPGEPPLPVERVFELVRDMPYERASSREPGVTVAEWRGTCSGKHYLLKALLEEYGRRCILIACTIEFTVDGAPWLPPELRAMVEERPVPDVHNFLRVETDDGWMTVDATWPLAARALGLPANERWVEGRDMRTIAEPIEIFHVPEDTDAQAFKQQIIDNEFAGQLERRERFIEGLSRWLGERLAGPRAER